jgi:glycosyltransferase involved in cell wall biosynthesis
VSALSIKVMNSYIERYNIDIIIILCDHHATILDDNKFNCKSIAWFPNHFEPLDFYSKNVLSIFNHIACLYPSCVSIVKKTLPNNNVTFIPHSIDPIDKPNLNKIQLRQKHRLPQDKLIISMIGGNYDMNNRRSYDTSIAAFTKFYERNPNSFIYIQAYTFQEIKGWCNDLQRLIDIYDLPEDCYRLLESKVEEHAIAEIYYFSDVFFCGSKAEGFGIPNIEAQLAGLPVVTNSFTALRDYTFNGVSVEPIQFAYDSIAGGMWCTPDINGLAKGLEEVCRNIDYYRKNSDNAIVKINKMMNMNKVTKQFIELFELPSDKNVLCQIIVRNSKNNKFILKNKDVSWEELQKNIYAPYLLFINELSELNRDFIKLVPELLLPFYKKSIPTIVLRTQLTNGQVYPDDGVKNLDPNKIFFIQETSFIIKMMKKNNWNDRIKYLETNSKNICVTQLVNKINTKNKY